MMVSLPLLAHVDRACGSLPFLKWGGGSGFDGGGREGRGGGGGGGDGNSGAESHLGCVCADANILF